MIRVFWRGWRRGVDALGFAVIEWLGCDREEDEILEFLCFGSWVLIPTYLFPDRDGMRRTEGE